MPFRALEQYVRENDMQTIAGVDCHKHSHTVAFIDTVGKVLETVEIPTGEAGYDRAIEAGRRVGTIRWGLESTGSYGADFAARLDSVGFIVYEVPGSVTKRQRKSSTRHGKSDAHDAIAVGNAVLMESDRLARYYPSTARETLRLLYDQRDRLVVQRSVAKNHLHSLTLRLGTKSAPRGLRSECALEKIAREATKISGGILVTATLLDDLIWTISDIRLANQRVKDMEFKVSDEVKSIAPELLKMHGVSAIVAAGIVGHSGSIRNCRDAGAFAMRCGTAPIPCSSDRNSTVRLSLGGNRQLNRLLHVIALVQVRTPGHDGRCYYERKRWEGKTHKAAFRALKRQLSTVVYYRLAPTDDRLQTASLHLAA